jgi:hypothetical protein
MEQDFKKLQTFYLATNPSYPPRRLYAANGKTKKVIARKLPLQ